MTPNPFVLTNKICLNQSGYLVILKYINITVFYSAQLHKTITQKSMQRISNDMSMVMQPSKHNSFAFHKKFQVYICMTCHDADITNV